MLHKTRICSTYTDTLHGIKWIHTKELPPGPLLLGQISNHLASSSPHKSGSRKVKTPHKLVHSYTWRCFYSKSLPHHHEKYRLPNACMYPNKEKDHDNELLLKVTACSGKVVCIAKAALTVPPLLPCHQWSAGHHLMSRYARTTVESGYLVVWLAVFEPTRQCSEPSLLKPLFNAGCSTFQVCGWRYKGKQAPFEPSREFSWEY